jgi:hypothetical protein
MFVRSSQVEIDARGVKLRVRERNSLVFRLSTTVMARRALPLEAFQTFSASRQMCVSRSASGMSSGKVSSAETCSRTRFDITGLGSMPRANS